MSLLKKLVRPRHLVVNVHFRPRLFPLLPIVVNRTPILLYLAHLLQFPDLLQHTLLQLLESLVQPIVIRLNPIALLDELPILQFQSHFKVFQFPCFLGQFPNGGFEYGNFDSQRLVLLFQMLLFFVELDRVVDEREGLGGLRGFLSEVDGFG